MDIRIILTAIVVALTTSGCSSMFNFSGETRNGVSSSLVDYLYPDGEEPPQVQNTIPQLALPLRVGIAFVPGPAHGRDAASEATKVELLQNVKQSFVDRDYISRIEVIPETYMRSTSGVSGMQQVARMYGVDVMALVSYDQVAVSDDNPTSFLYWTIVGAYVIPATSNEIQTFVDTAVFDVNSSRLLFRAPGLNRSSDRSTLMESGEVVRKGREASFAVAIEQMTGNLSLELDRFTQRVQDSPEVATVTWKEGYGGGSFGLLMLLPLVALLWRRASGQQVRRQHRHRQDLFESLPAFFNARIAALDVVGDQVHAVIVVNHVATIGIQKSRALLGTSLR